MKKLFIFFIIIFASFIKTQAQTINVIDNDGVFLTEPYSPITNIQIVGGQYAFGEDDLMCYALKWESNYSIVLLKPNFENKHFPEGIKVIFSNSNPNETLVFNPQTQTREGLDLMICNINSQFLSRFINTQFINVGIKYPNGKIVTYPIFNKNSMKAHLTRLMR